MFVAYIFYFLCFIGGLAGGLVVFSAVITTTQSAVQQTTLIALGVSLPLIPYLMARSAESLWGNMKVKKEES